MAKHRVLLAAPPGLARPVFRKRMLRETAPAVLSAAPELSAASICLAEAQPVAPPWRQPGEPAAPAEPPFDAVLDLWGPRTSLATALAVLADLLPYAPRASARVAETIEKDDLPRPPHAAAPGVKVLSLLTFQEDLPAPAARRLWAHHAKLARRVHAGAVRYLRDWVLELTPEMPPVPRFHGISELHFPSVEAMSTGWFDSEAGRAALLHDSGHFLAAATRFCATEHVLKA